MSKIGVSRDIFSSKQEVVLVSKPAALQLKAQQFVVLDADYVHGIDYQKHQTS